MIQNVSFKGVMPVEFYAKNPSNNKYVPVVKPENVKKCQSFVIRNLNGSITSNSNVDFIREYLKQDKDFAKCPVARTVYDKEVPVVTTTKNGVPYYVYLVTGSHTDTVDKLGKELGKVKADVFERTGKRDGFEVKEAQKNYFKELKNFVFKQCPRVKNEFGDKTIMRVFFDPKYDKNGKLKNFIYKDVMFYGENERSDFKYVRN